MSYSLHCASFRPLRPACQSWRHCHLRAWPAPMRRPMRSAGPRSPRQAGFQPAAPPAVAPAPW
eukprot:15098-Alexandrium_andersonii.AAC.1